MKKNPHLSVLLQEVLDAFSPLSLHSFVDGTLGAGGHAEALLNHHPELHCYIGIDQDPEALQLAKERLTSWEEKVKFIHGNFTQIDTLLKKCHVNQVEGILLDIGVSSMQFDQPEKGFSFSYDGPLDMRMNPEQELTAEEVVNTWSEEDLARVFRDYGEEKQWRRAARAIVQKRTLEPIQTTKQLVDALDGVIHKKKPHIHPVTQVFQALRICVNRELDVLREVIPKAISLLKPGGRLAIISFHSLEDRIVKNAFRYAADDKEQTSGVGGLFLDKTPEVNLITRKALKPSSEEMAQNPRSRSAKLRVVEKR